eukprot:1648570-Amphidinium_carterae.1
MVCGKLLWLRRKPVAPHACRRFVNDEHKADFVVAYKTLPAMPHNGEPVASSVDPSRAFQQSLLGDYTWGLGART